MERESCSRKHTKNVKLWGFFFFFRWNRAKWFSGSEGSGFACALFGILSFIQHVDFFLGTTQFAPELRHRGQETDRYNWCAFQERHFHGKKSPGSEGGTGPEQGKLRESRDLWSKHGPLRLPPCLFGQLCPVASVLRSLDVCFLDVSVLRGRNSQPCVLESAEVSVTGPSCVAWLLAKSAFPPGIRDSMGWGWGTAGDRAVIYPVHKQYCISDRMCV